MSDGGRTPIDRYAGSAPSPLRSLTRREDSVAELIGIGYSQRRVARTLGLEARYVAMIVQKIADKLPNPHDLSPHALVMLWAAHRRWTRERDTAA